MKNFVVTLIVFSALLFTGCSQKFNIAAPYKNITVVYGFLDEADTAHYIRIQKAFLDQNKSAIAMAKTPDSSFYASLNVRITRYNIADTTHPADTIHLNRVDLDLEGYPKPTSGQFFGSPNYAYKFTNKLDPNYIYHIVITNGATGEADSSEAPIIDDKPGGAFYMDVMDTSHQQYLSFARTTNNEFFDLTGYYAAPPDFSFENLNSPVSIGQTIIRFNWVDSNYLTHALTRQYYDYNAGYFNVGNSGSLDVKIYNSSMYSAVAAALDPAPANTYRLLDRCNVFVYLSTFDFNQYLQFSLTAGTGLTGGEIEPIYSNIRGANAIGLFTSRAMRSAPITMTTETIDSLRASSILSAANIAGTVY